jgi:uncharacterized protein
MQLTNRQTLPVSQVIAWEALNDVEMLKASIPGCESLTPLGDDGYEVVVLAAIGPVKARFKGRLQLSDLQPPSSYRIAFEGQGGPAGHGKGTAEVRLEANGTHETVLNYTATARVGGKIAQVGQRLVDAAAQRMAGEFFTNFDAQLRQRHAPAASSPGTGIAQAPTVGLWARLKQWLRKLVAPQGRSA